MADMEDVPLAEFKASIESMKELMLTWRADMRADYADLKREMREAVRTFTKVCIATGISVLLGVAAINAGLYVAIYGSFDAGARAQAQHDQMNARLDRLESQMQQVQQQMQQVQAQIQQIQTTLVEIQKRLPPPPPPKK